MSTAQIFAHTIEQLRTMSMAELSALKLQVGEKAFADPGDPLDLDTPREDVDDSDSPYHDATTESFFVLMDLIDQELEKRKS